VKPLAIFGLFAVTAMLVTYTLEKRSHWYILAFAMSCGLESAYGFLQGAWPFGIVEAIQSDPPANERQRAVLKLAARGFEGKLARSKWAKYSLRPSRLGQS
jgi:hypothetical protein